MRDGQMSVSDTLLNLHILAEGKVSTPYLDGGGVLTQGIGHTSDEVYPIIEGVSWSDDMIYEVWRHDISEAVRLANHWLEHPVPQEWFDVTVDLIFNCGKPKTYLAYLNLGEFDLAREQILRWIYDGGKVYLGLVKRRFANYAITLGDEWEPFLRCNATGKNLKPLNDLIAKYGYEVLRSSRTNFYLVSDN